MENIDPKTPIDERLFELNHAVIALSTTEKFQNIAGRNGINYSANYLSILNRVRRKLLEHVALIMESNFRVKFPNTRLALAGEYVFHPVGKTEVHDPVSSEDPKT